MAPLALLPKPVPSARPQIRAAVFVRLGAALLGLVTFAFPLPARATERLRVRAETSFSGLGLSRHGEWLDLSGTLRDDAGVPVVGAEVVLSASGLEPTRILDCAGHGVPETATAGAVPTDAGGTFCVRFPSSVPLAGATITFAGDAFRTDVGLAIPGALSAQRLRLRFDSPRLAASLDEPVFLVNVTTDVADGGGSTDPIRLTLSHRTEPGAQETELGAADLIAGAVAKFNVETRLLGSPGSGRLVASFAGSDRLAAVEESIPIERRATVRLALALELSASDPADGIDLLVGASSAIGAVPGGWVEATLDAHPVGTGKVLVGAARVNARFAAPRGRSARLELRYIPEESGWAPGTAVAIDVPLTKRKPWTLLPWFLTAAGIAYWVVVRTWRRPKSSPRARPRDAGSSGRAAVDVLSRGAARSGWSGRVLDAHDGTPIGGAQVQLLVPVFDGEGIAGTHVAGDDGSFTIPHVEAARSDGARLVVSAPHHSTLREPVPPDGVLSVCLVSRRRTLLERMARWVARMGAPWATTKDPTPGEVATLAARENREEVAAWATAVERAAYGPVAPDERRESELTTSEPQAQTGRERVRHDER